MRTWLVTWAPAGAVLVRARNGQAAKAKVLRAYFASYTAPRLKAVPYRDPADDDHEQLALALN
jgi:hypothetical protein